MIDLTEIPEETMRARGAYSTVRAAHEDEKKRLSILCGQLQSTAAMVLRRMQPDNNEVAEGVAELLASGRKVLDDMEACAKQIESLAKQRAELKPLAWH